MLTTDITELIGANPSSDRDELIGNIEISSGVYVTRKFKLSKLLEGTTLPSLVGKSDSQTVGGTLSELCDAILSDEEITTADIDEIFDEYNT